MAQPIPQALSQLVTLNVEYSILICTGNRCRRAVRPAGFAAHVRRKHKVLKDVWKQVEQYFEEFPFEGVINGTLKSTGVHKLVQVNYA